MCFNMQGALPTPWLSVNLACLSACHPTIPEQLMQASLALCALPVISVFAHAQLFIFMHTFMCMLTHTKIKLRIYL